MFNSISMTQMAASIAKALGVEAPKLAREPIPQVEKLIENTCGKPVVDRIMIYNPDAIGMWLYQKYTKEFAPVMERTQLAVPVATVMPSVTPVCFGSMYTGAFPEEHGIMKYEKPVIKIDTLFDAMVRAGKKVALVADDDSSMSMIFKERDIDYYIMPYDGECVEKGLELIKEDKYDMVIVYNMEYDDCMHDTVPESDVSIAAMKHHIDAFEKLVDAVKENWTSHDTLVCWATDHGIHLDENPQSEYYTHGNHGDFIPEDINVMHFYGAYPKKDK